ncbi:MAG: HD domain-containing protein [Desulfobacteraceae bacterium]
MTPEDLTRLETWFDAFVQGFYRQDPLYDRPLHLKYHHSRRVRDDIRMLGGRLGLPELRLRLAQAAALMHDVGRFPQYARYGTFLDRASVNHAHLSLRTMAAQRVLHALPRDERRLITRAVAFHNAARLPDEPPGFGRLLMRLLRDADKLDIWKVVTDYYDRRREAPDPVIELGLPDPPTCSPAAIKSLAAGRMVDLADLRCLNDFKLLQLGWVFDLNFQPAFQALQARGYIQKITASLPPANGLGAALERVRRHVAAGCAVPGGTPGG